MRRRGTRGLAWLADGALLVGSTLGCAGIRGAMMDANNENMVGESAPEIAGGEWIRPFLDASPEAGSADWTLLAFFLPW